MLCAHNCTPYGRLVAYSSRHSWPRSTGSFSTSTGLPPFSSLLVHLSIHSITSVCHCSEFSGFRTLHTGIAPISPPPSLTQLTAFAYQ